MSLAAEAASAFLALVVLCWRHDVEKDVELGVLRHQVRVLERQLHSRVG